MSFEPFEPDAESSARCSRDPDRAFARAVDIVGAGFGLVLLAPLLLMLALAVRLTSRGPALFCSIRVGRNGRPFTLYKFRSMTDDAQDAGPAITTAQDSRVTPLGKWLRRKKLDELPQLLNVVKGDMSLVGPRPEDPSYVARYSRQQLGILAAKPGMTSPASLRYRSEEAQLMGEDWENHYVADLMPAKLAIDAEYLQVRNVRSDVLLIMKTIARLLGLGSES